MFNSFIDAYFLYCKMVLDTSTVLNYRLPLLNSMASEPVSSWSAAQWMVQLQRKILRPVKTTLSANARRIKKKK